jgi:hypothetical protein
MPWTEGVVSQPASYGISWSTTMECRFATIFRIIDFSINPILFATNWLVLVDDTMDPGVKAKGNFCQFMPGAIDFIKALDGNSRRPSEVDYYSVL